MDQSEATNQSVALETWTIREQLKANCEDSLRKVRAIGFQHLEVANTGERPLDEFVRMCARHDLKIIGLHQSPLNAGNFEDLMDDIKRHVEVSGAKYVTVMLDPDDRGDARVYEHYGDLCSKAGEFLQRQDVVLSYHCYNYDLIPVEKDHSDAKSGVDILLEKTSPEQLLLQLDTYFMYKVMRETKVSIEDLLEKYSSRCQLIHLCDINDKGQRASLGTGSIPWSEFIEALRVCCSPTWYIIENDTLEPFASIREGLTYIVEYV